MRSLSSAFSSACEPEQSIAQPQQKRLGLKGTPMPTSLENQQAPSRHSCWKRWPIPAPKGRAEQWKPRFICQTSQAELPSDESISADIFFCLPESNESGKISIQNETESCSFSPPLSSVEEFSEVSFAKYFSCPCSCFSSPGCSDYLPPPEFLWHLFNDPKQPTSESWMKRKRNISKLLPNHFHLLWTPVWLWFFFSILA